MATPKIVQLDEPKKETFIDKVATEALLLGLKTLSQRALVAIGNLFTVFATASAFFLAYDIAPNPTVNQLVELTIYGCFLLLLHVIRRRE